MLEGWFFITAALLGVSGGAKIRDPEPTRGALRVARLPSSTATVVLLGGVEIVVAGLALAGGSPVGAAAHAALYLGFAAFVALALARRLPIASCGCFGRADTPPSGWHLAVNLTAAAAGVAVALRGGPGIPEVVVSQPAWGLPYLGYLALGVFLLTLTLTSLPTLLATVRRTR